MPYLPGSVNGCDSATYVVLRIINNQYQNVDITTTAPVCPGDQNGNITIRAIEGCLVNTLIIDGVSYGEVSLPFILSDLKAGNYKVELSSADGCSYKETLTVKPATTLLLCNYSHFTEGSFWRRHSSGHYNPSRNQPP